MLRADHALRAVAVEGPGPHAIRFKYREPWVKRTLPVSLALVLVALLILLRFPRRLVERLFPEEEGE